MPQGRGLVRPKLIAQFLEVAGELAGLIAEVQEQLAGELDARAAGTDPLLELLEKDDRGVEPPTRDRGSSVRIRATRLKAARSTTLLPLSQVRLNAAQLHVWPRARRLPLSVALAIGPHAAGIRAILFVVVRRNREQPFAYNAISQ